MTQLAFDVAIRHLLDGGKIARDRWEKGVYITVKNDTVQMYTPPLEINQKVTGWRKLITGWCEYSALSEEITAHDWVLVLAEDK